MPSIPSTTTRTSRQLVWQLLIILFTLVSAFGCSGGGSTESHQVLPAAPTITDFKVDKDPVTLGHTTTLTAVFTGGTGTVDKSVGGITSGNPVTTGIVSADTVFTLTVQGTGGTVTKTCTAHTAPVPLVPYLSSSSSSLMAGQGGYTASVPLQTGLAFTWTIVGGTLTAGANTAQVTFAAGAIGTLQLSCTATNAAGTVSSPGLLAIPVVQGPTIAAFTATPATITAGQLTNLTWSVQNATSLSIDNGVGTVSNSSGTLAVTPATTTTYTLTATNNVGTVTRTVSVTVIPQGQKPVISSFTSTPSTITGGQTVSLAWSAAWAATLSLDNGIGTVTGTSLTVTPTTTTTYTLTATNSAGTATAAAMVTVIPAGQKPVINTFTGTPASINVGQSSTLGWSVTGATALSLDNSLGTVSGTSLVVTPSKTTTYTLTATNGSGSVTATTTVTVGNTVTYTLPGNVNLDLVLIPAGTFTMGSVNTVNSYAQPPHQVTISQPFYMGKFVVTQQQYQAVMGVNPGSPLDPQNPVNYVPYSMITQAGGFLAMLNTYTAASRPAGLSFRLPTEAEWEYACRGGTITEWYFGNDPTIAGSYAWYSGNTNNTTNKVGQKLPNPFGLYDMVGNVSQWCQDYTTFSGYTSAAQVDPVGPLTGTNRILRGGCYYQGPDYLRSAQRSNSWPTNTAYEIGFRVVLAVPRNP